MNIQYKNINWKVNLYFIVLIAILFTDRLFLEFFIAEDENSAGLRTEITTIAILASVFILPSLDKFMKVWFFIVILLLGFLFMESYFHYRTFFKFPHVFSKVTELFLIPFAYIFFRDKSKKYIRNIVYFLIIVTIIHLIFIKPYVFTFASFLDTERGLHASSTLLLLLPAIFLFDEYMSKNKMMTFFLFLMIISLILFLNHRSVWMATMAAFIVNSILVKKRGAFRIHYSAYAPLIFVPLVFILIFSSLILSKNPEVVERFIERVEDIQKMDEQGTGNWRLKQIESYWPFIEQHFMFGMRLKGFELPVQFYAAPGRVVFLDNTGHHFHSFYADALFYLGLFGLLLKTAPIFYAFKLGFSKPSLNVPQITMLSFLGGLLIYGLAYDWSFYMYAFIGITLAQLNPRNEEVDDKKDEFKKQAIAI